MHATSRHSKSIRLWSPAMLPADGPLGHAVADCLAAAFSSGVWARTPMPVGSRSDPHSARGIVAELGPDAYALIASVSGGRPRGGEGLLGCVVGGVLDDDLIRAYGLRSYGAIAGDGLLAYIGVQPTAQGVRLLPRGEDSFDVAPPTGQSRMKRPGTSLAGILFSRWLGLSAIEQCRRVFVRTRSVLPQIQHLAAKNGFRFQGQFDLEFQGQRQDRMVYTRINAPLASQPLPLVA